MALLSIAFNIGAPRLAKFHNMRRAIARLFLAVRGKSGRFGQCVKQGRESAGLAGTGLVTALLAGIDLIGNTVKRGGGGPGIFLRFGHTAVNRVIAL